MKSLKQKLIKRAMEKFGQIKKIAFTMEQNLLIYWFNDQEGSTHVLLADISSQECFD